MFLPWKPSATLIKQFISSQKHLPFSYSQVGATRNRAPAGFIVDNNRIKLGDGKETYDRAVAALRNWKHFELGWVTVVPPKTAIEVGAAVAIEANTFGFWSLNACRIVYVIDEEGRKFGFAYGTLPDHAKCGEERFTIEFHQDGSVWYDIFAFSRPQKTIVRLGFPLGRMLQKRFSRESLAAMIKASRAEDTAESFSPFQRE
jgi:uncharacterized protein (UPF0548 family)